MKIAILSRNKNLYSTKRLVDAGEKRGHEIEVIDVLKCYMNITSKKPSVHFQNRALDYFDAVIPRIGASITFYGCAVLRQFEMMGVFPLNDTLAITRSRDKLRALQVLSRKGVGLPVTGFGHSLKRTEDLIQIVGGAPLVIKLLEGTQGKGVVLAETKKAAQSTIEAFRSLGGHFLVQQFIGEAKASDLRCFVVGEKVIASMKRVAKEGEFRANLHLGGHVEKVKITPKERETAVDAAKALGLRVAGVDILQSESGPLVIEVNSSPGLEGIEKASEKDVADLIIAYIEKHATPGKPWKKAKG